VPATNAALKPTGNVYLNGSYDGSINGPSVVITSGSTGNWEIQVSATFVPSSTELFSIGYSGDTNYSGASASSGFVTVIIPDFSINVPGPLLLTAGQSGSLQIGIIPATTNSSPVTLSCAGNMPAGYNCSVQPATVSLANGVTASATLTLSPVPLSHAVSAIRKRAFLFSLRSDLFSSNPFWPISIATGFAALTLLVCPYRRKLFRPTLGFAAICLISLMLGCGGGGGGTGTGAGGGAGGPGGGGTPGPSATTTTVSTSASSVAQGSPVTFTAKVAGPGNPTGTVAFYLNGSWFGQANLVAGTATISASPTFPGIYALTATYNGDPSNNSSTSAPVNQVITGSTSIQLNAQTASLFHFSNVTVTVQ
jgi:hypothetical protein